MFLTSGVGIKDGVSIEYCRAVNAKRLEIGIYVWVIETSRLFVGLRLLLLTTVLCIDFKAILLQMDKKLFFVKYTG